MEPRTDYGHEDEGNDPDREAATAPPVGAEHLADEGPDAD